jgi:hypothetical protein
VAEFAVQGVPTYRCAWALLILACAYPGIAISEMQGGGGAIISEVQRAQLGVAGGYSPALLGHFANLQHYSYKRPDMVSRGGTLLHWSTNQSNRERMLSTLRDFVERSNLICRSLPFLKELSAFARTADGDLESMGSEHDDRVMAMALALMAYVDHESMNIGGTQYTYEYFAREREIEAGGKPYDISDLLLEKIRQKVGNAA